jgi:diguanylate cyclase (GGDEF)-like protein/PAS domain S-box-containing protein
VPLPIASTDQNITSIVSRVALLVALTVTLALPVGYWFVVYHDFSRDLEFKARVKASALGELIASLPDTWIYTETNLQGLLTRVPVPLDTEAVHVYDDRGNLVTQAGEIPAPPVLRRAYPLYDGTRVAGRVEVSDTLRGMMVRTAIAAVLGLLLGLAVFIALRTIPLRALRRATRALSDQKQRAEVTLRSIGDGVITTDATSRVEYMNPVAERLSGWTLSEAKLRPLDEILPLIDANTGDSVATPLMQALAEKRIVAFEREVDLLRRDGSKIGINDSAAPLVDENGKVSGGVLVFHDVSAARDITHRRSWEAAHDVLTGLVNRREFDGLVAVAAASARIAGKHHVVGFMDLDQFKVVNDTSGHAAGDDLLKKLAVLLQSRIRASDTLARLGGDEFGLLLDGCSLERAQFIAADLLAAVGDFRFNWDGKVFGIGVSIGLATMTGDSASGAEVLSMADAACYWAKEQGRNRVCVYRVGDSDMATRRREMGWIARINAALAEKRFTLYHQSFLPLNAAAGARAHLEVLIRMIDEQGNLIQPGSFLPAAERYNLMPAIDRWVIRTVFAGYHGLVAERGGAPLTCAINLSGTSLNAEGFLDYIRQQALEYALPPLAICFEITETAAVNNLRKAAEFIKECKAMGFLFALDDFGTGTSSFGYLKNLPVDYLKIDGGFVKNLERDVIDKAMTETINRVGHIMGIKTVAEYAENETIIQELKSMGVDYAQGYGVCTPTPLFGAVPKAVALPQAAAVTA